MEIAARTIGDRCDCGNFMVYFYLRNQSVLAETGTHGKCTNLPAYTNAQVAAIQYTHAYHYCFMMHSARGAGTNDDILSRILISAIMRAK